MGDKVSEVDCALFGMLSQIKWHMPGTVYEKALTGISLFSYVLYLCFDIWRICFKLHIYIGV